LLGPSVTKILKDGEFTAFRALYEQEKLLPTASFKKFLLKKIPNTLSAICSGAFSHEK